MQPVLSNRIVFVLACAGLFIALFVGILHYANVSLPCGPGEYTGCDGVQMDDWSKFLGLPIAFFGAGLYLLVALCAFSREVLGLENTPRLAFSIWLLLASGVVISMLLLGRAEFTLHLRCNWCLASGITMALAFLIHTLGTVGNRPIEGKRLPLMVPGVLLLVSIGTACVLANMEIGKGRLLFQIKEIAASPTMVYRPSNPVFGESSAKTVAVAFSDLFCPSCKENHAWIKSKLEGELKGKVKFVFRNFPLPTHPGSLDAAFYGAWAQRQGKFWEYADAVYSSSPEEFQDDASFTTLLGGIGCNPQEAQKIATDENLKISLLEQVQKDLVDAAALKVSVTPTWFVVYPNGKVFTAQAGGIKNLLSLEKLKENGG